MSSSVAVNVPDLFLWQRKLVISRAMDRMAVLQQSGNEISHKMQEVIGREDHIRVFSDSVHVYKETLKNHEGKHLDNVHVNIGKHQGPEEGKNSRQ